MEKNAFFSPISLLKKITYFPMVTLPIPSFLKINVPYSNDLIDAI